VLAMSLWVAFTAERDARLRLDRAKRAFAVHGDASRLLRDHWVVLLVVLLAARGLTGTDHVDGREPEE